MPYQSKLKMECSKAVESGGGVRGEGHVEDMVVTTSGAAALLDPLDRQAWKGM